MMGERKSCVHNAACAVCTHDTRACTAKNIISAVKFTRLLGRACNQIFWFGQVRFWSGFGQVLVRLGLGLSKKCPKDESEFTKVSTRIHSPREVSIPLPLGTKRLLGYQTIKGCKLIKCKQTGRFFDKNRTKRQRLLKISAFISSNMASNQYFNCIIMAKNYKMSCDWLKEM